MNHLPSFGFDHVSAFLGRRELQSIATVSLSMHGHVFRLYSLELESAIDFSRYLPVRPAIKKSFLNNPTKLRKQVTCLTELKSVILVAKDIIFKTLKGTDENVRRSLIAGKECRKSRFFKNNFLKKE